MRGVEGTGTVAGEKDAETLEIERIEAIGVASFLLGGYILPFIAGDRGELADDGLVVDPGTDAARPEVGEQGQQLVLRHVGRDVRSEERVQVLGQLLLVARRRKGEAFPGGAAQTQRGGSFFVFGLARRRLVFELLRRVEHLRKVSAQRGISAGFRFQVRQSVTH